MGKFICLIPGEEIADAAEDFRAAQKVEQYRLGKEAVYLPQGFRWEYLPRRGILRAEQSHRVISAGHCVTVREEKPAVDLIGKDQTWTLNLEKPASMQTVLADLRKEERSEEA